MKNVTCKPGSRCAHWNYDFNTKPTEGFLFLVNYFAFLFFLLTTACAVSALFSLCMKLVQWTVFMDVQCHGNNEPLLISLSLLLYNCSPKNPPDQGGITVK